MHALVVDEPLRLQRRHTLSRTWWYAAVGAYTLLVVDIVGHVVHPTGQPTHVWALFMVKLTVYLGAALWVWGWRFRRLGVIWFVAGVGHLLADLPATYPGSILLVTVGVIAALNWPGFSAHWGLAYPTGRLEPHWAIWAWVLINYIGDAIQTIPVLLFDSDQQTLFYVGHTVGWLDSWNWWWTLWWYVLILPLMWYAVVYRVRKASPALRRSILPFYTVVLATGFFSLWWGLTVLRGSEDPLSVGPIGDSMAGILLSGSAVLGLLVTRRARGVVGDLVVDLGRVGPGGVRGALAKAIGDPTLELALWVPRKKGWVDEQGREVELPDGHDRAVTLVGDRLAAIVHDPVLLDQPALLEAAGSAARFALENERLQAELRAQLAELRESRARIVRAGDEERRRLERDLHDGAQQRLLGLGMALQLLQSHVDRAGEPLLEETKEELQEALAELRELARGIHPAVLTEHGLGAALRSLAARAPLPVEVEGCSERLPEPVETAAFFVVSEALTNIAKYARATEAQVRVERSNGRAHIEVHDNGVGGANPRDGSGLNGLADRVAALNGQLHIHSPAGAGTSITAEIPCRQ